MNIKQIQASEITNDIPRLLSFAETFIQDSTYTDPFVKDAQEFTKMLEKTSKQQNNTFFLIEENHKILGFFVFLIIERENYGELLHCYCRNKQAYALLLKTLKEQYAGHTFYFVYNARNEILNKLLKEEHAVFYEEQMQMIAEKPKSISTTIQVIPLSPENIDSYIIFHRKDGYWTGEKISRALDRFDVWIVQKGRQTIGYIDITKHKDPNHIFDIYVDMDKRKCGIGKSLLLTAMYYTDSSHISLDVDVTNIPAIKLYESADFQKNRPNTITAELSFQKLKFK